MEFEQAAALRDTKERQPLSSRILSLSSVAAALGVVVVYLAAMRAGWAAPGRPISTLWPANALLMAALLVTPRRVWPLALAILLPAHVLFQRQFHVPLATSFGWYVGNAGEALLGAALLRTASRGEPVLDTVRSGIRFVLYGALLAPLVTSFWDAAVVVSTGFGTGYWNLFFTRLLSNVVAVLFFVPPVVLGFEGGVRRLLEWPARRRIEAAALASAVVAVCLVVAVSPAIPAIFILEICAPLTCLVWAAWRFTPFESSLAVLAVGLFEVERSAFGRGVFGFGTPEENLLSLQTYLATIAIPLLLFALAEREKRRANRDLRRNEERLVMSLAVSRLANWEYDLASDEVILAENRVGFLPVRLVNGLPLLFAVVHPDDRERVIRAHEDAVRCRGSYETECRVYDEAGGLHWVRRTGQVFCDPEGRPVRVLGVTREITERKRAEEALAEAQRIAVLARTAARMVIWSVNLEIGEVYAEPTLPSLLGFDSAPERSSLRFWLSRVHEPDLPVLAAVRESVLATPPSADGTGEIQIPELEYRMRHADGTLRWFLARGTVERGPNGEVRRIVGTAMDVTGRKAAEIEAEEQRRELTRLARVNSLGELSAALAHELNQPLTSVLSNAQAARLLIATESPDLAEIARILDDITSEDRRAGEVIRRLRNLLRKGTSRLEEVDVNPVVEEILGLMRGDLIARNVAVRTVLSSALPPVRADPIELQQVLLNLILNACDAMESVPGGDRIVSITTTPEDSLVIVAVSDVGSGIPAESMSSLFKPFFTTKSHGIGIGLSICQSIISGIGGRLWAENNPERGATFRFALPSAPLRPPRA